VLIDFTIAANMNDLFTFDPETMTWSDITKAFRGQAPSQRVSHGFSSNVGKLYLFGGFDGLGESVTVSLHKFASKSPVEKIGSISDSAIYKSIPK
jgi:hypothetical protein